MHYVVGSGPAGVACAKALLAESAEVTMLDVGLTLEEERASKMRSLQRIPVSDWRGEAGSFLRDGMQSGTAGIPLKLAYGSDYPYRAVDGTTPVEFDNSKASSSQAIGGLSTVWGSAVMPYHARDLAGWPFPAEELAPAYRAIFEWMPLSGESDDLAEPFPLYSDRPSPLEMSRQASQLLETMRRHKSRLTKAGVVFGRSRLAVATDGFNESAPCVQCGLCMYGCPHQLIYSSDRAVEEMKCDRNFHYVPEMSVRSVKEVGAGVEVLAMAPGRNALIYRGERVYLAAGLYATTAILLRSMNRYDSPVRIADSQYFLLPLLRAAGAGNVTDEKLHTLAQLFLEVADEAISPYTIHLQTYTYNDLFNAPVEGALGPLRRLFPLNQFLGRLLLFQGYLHSAHSSHLTASLVKTGPEDRLMVKGEVNPDTKATMGKLVWKLLSLSGALGAIPLAPLLQMGQPGRGYHSGGSFPMHKDPVEGQCDTEGRPTCYTRVHAVDSTVFPSIAATTITLTAMANAYRIGSRVGRYS